MLQNKWCLFVAYFTVALNIIMWKEEWKYCVLNTGVIVRDVGLTLRGIFILSSSMGDQLLFHSLACSEQSRVFVMIQVFLKPR